ncbi:thymidylate synthase [Streptomyces chrestomyceticus]|uniref:Thymidylate synthase n=1 Tax=Streptomyces chrestomyceticus TaxID=68185 RepID=A0ABU7WQN8_9ACTN
MNMPLYHSFQDAYLAQLRETFENSAYRNAPRGFRSRERIGVGFGLLDPVQRHVTLPARRANLVFNYAEALWYLSGTNGLDFIGHYASSIAHYSQDGRTLQGTAYGPRIFRHPPDGLDQWQNVLNTLREDPDSKRAVMQIFTPRELTVPGNIDVACTLALQFMIREGKLCTVGFMRANDAFRGMVSDVFSFTVLQEVMARELGVGVGSYSHHVGSVHVYDSDAPWADQVLAEAARSPAPPTPFPAMPPQDNWPCIQEVLNWEARLRTDSVRLSPSALERLDLPPYWRNVIGLFECYRQVRHGTGLAPQVAAVLPGLHRRALATRWPGHFAGALAQSRT